MTVDSLIILRFAKLVVGTKTLFHFIQFYVLIVKGNRAVMLKKKKEEK